LIGFRLAAVGALAVGLAFAAAGLAVGADVLPPTPSGDALPPQVARRGEEIYATRCAGCHDAGERAPQRSLLAFMAPQAIHRALSRGIMRPMAAGLSEDDMRAVAEVMAGRRMTTGTTAPKMCARGASPFDYAEPPPFANWGLAPGNAHAISPKVARLDREQVGRLQLRWAFAYPDATQVRSQPTLAGGAVFVGGQDGTVLALDRTSGCARWMFRAGGEVRTGIAVTPWRAGDRKARPLIYFGDELGRVYAVDAITGELRWDAQPDSHPAVMLSGPPTLFEGKLLVPVSSQEELKAVGPGYECCTFRGSIVAYDARTGAQLWRTYTIDPPTVRGDSRPGPRRFAPSGGAIWSAPTVDAQRRRVYITTGDAYSSPAAPLTDAILALDLDTGRIIWSYQATAGDAWNVACILPNHPNCADASAPDFDFGAPPVLAAANDGEAFLLAGQKSGTVYGLDPETGRLRWSTKVGSGGPAGGVHFGMSAQGGRLFVPVTDYAPKGMAKDAKPGVYALDIKTGRVLWRYTDVSCEDRPRLCRPGFGGPPTAVGDYVLVGGDDGRLRALDSASGAQIWTFDTARAFTTVNGDIAHGGAISALAGPLAHQGMVFTNSGYGFGGKMPGGVLLVLAPSP